MSNLRYSQHQESSNPRGRPEESPSETARVGTLGDEFDDHFGLLPRYIDVSIANNIVVIDM